MISGSQNVQKGRITEKTTGLPQLNPFFESTTAGEDLIMALQEGLVTPPIKIKSDQRTAALKSQGGLGQLSKNSNNKFSLLSLIQPSNNSISMKGQKLSKTLAKLKIISWNVSSMKKETYRAISKEDAHFIALQETRKHINNTPRYTFHNKVRSEDPKAGGGIAVGIHKDFSSSNRNDLIPEDLKMLEMLLVHAAFPGAQVFIINIYIPPQSKSLFKLKKKSIERWILELFHSRPSATFLIAGDFNQKTPPFNIFAMSNPPFTFSRTLRVDEKLVTRKSITDWILLHPKTSHEISSLALPSSDHVMLRATVNIEMTQKAIPILVPQKKNCLINCHHAAQNSTTFQEFIQNLQDNPFLKSTTLHKIRVHNPNNSKKPDLEQIVEELKTSLFSGGSLKGFRLLKNLTILNPSKREAGIMSCSIDDKGEIETNKEAILASCLTLMSSIQTRENFNPVIPKKDFRTYLKTSLKTYKDECRQIKAYPLTKYLIPSCKKQKK